MSCILSKPRNASVRTAWWVDLQTGKNSHTRTVHTDGRRCPVVYNSVRTSKISLEREDHMRLSGDVAAEDLSCEIYMPTTTPSEASKHCKMPAAASH